MRLFGKGQDDKNRGFFLAVFDRAEPVIIEGDRPLRDPCRLVAAAGNIAAINAVSSIPTLKRAWGKGSEVAAKELTNVFTLAFLAMFVHADGVAAAMKDAGFKGGLAKFGKAAAELVAAAHRSDPDTTSALFKEFDTQSKHDVATASIALPALVYFHAYCCLKGINAAGYWLGKDGERLPLKTGLLPLPEPGLVQVLTRAATHGIKLDEFLPHKESATVIARVVELMSICLGEARRQIFSSPVAASASPVLGAP